MCAQPVVLVVEDEPILRLSVESELTARGWPVAAVATGEDALALTKERDIGAAQASPRYPCAICLRYGTRSFASGGRRRVFC